MVSWSPGSSPVKREVRKCCCDPKEPASGLCLLRIADRSRNSTVISVICSNEATAFVRKHQIHLSASPTPSTARGNEYPAWKGENAGHLPQPSRAKKIRRSSFSRLQVKFWTRWQLPQEALHPHPQSHLDLPVVPCVGLTCRLKICSVRKRESFIS